MKVLVTGGFGMVGSHLVERLVTEEHEVYVIDDLSNSTPKNIESVSAKPNFHYRICDVSSFSNVFTIPVGKPDAIFHLACHPRSISLENPQRDVEVNVLSTINLLKVFPGVPIYFSSNSGIHNSNTDIFPLNEDSQIHLTTPYDADKYLSEQYLNIWSEVYKTPFVVFRFPAVYGPRQRLSDGWRPVITEFCNALLTGRQPTIYGDGSQTRDFCYVDDIVDALILALNKKPYGNVLMLGTNTETSILRLYQIIESEVGVISHPKYEPAKLADIKRMRYSYARAQSVLGWTPKTSLHVGIRKTLDAMIENLSR